MIILHAGVYEKEFFLWGEKPGETEPLPPRQRGQKNKKGVQSARAHPLILPYDAGVRDLAAALVEAGIDFTIPQKSTGKMMAWLPTVESKPIASSPLIAEPPVGSTDASTLAPWAVTAIHLTSERAVSLLCACVGKPTLAPGVIVGKDLSFWAMAMRFAGALVAKQQFLPGVIETNGTYHAHWKPIFAGPDADRLTKVAQAMPHVCRALTREDARQVTTVGTPPEIPAGSVLSDFIAVIVDSLVRASATEPVSLIPAPAHGSKPRGQPSSFDSLHDQWFHALRSPAAVLQGETPELAHFAGQVRDWQRPVSVSIATPYRLFFRLEEPSEEAEPDRDRPPVFPGRSPWYVRYLLQAVDDPSLLIPAKDAWKGDGLGSAWRASTLFKREGFDAREYLLLSLGQAAGICPRIETSLKKSAPGGYELDANGAYEFFLQKAFALEQAGFGVMLPAWWTGKGTKQRLSARAVVRAPKMQGGSGLSLAEVVQFDWEVSLGGEKLSLQELRALAKLKAPLVKVRGQWVQMSAEEILAALNLLKQKTQSQTTAREALQMALGGIKIPGSLTFDGVTATGWLADFLAQLDGSTAYEELPVSPKFQGALRPYQRRGYSWLVFLRQWGLGACLADDMGLGKTIQTLALLQRDWQGDEKRPVLLICPTSVVNNWLKEAGRFTPELPVMIHHGIARTKGSTFKEKALKQSMVISSYALVHRDFETLKEVPWAGVVLDEAQNIKNPETKQARAVRALQPDYRLALTGTPVENNVGDLWSIMEFLNPGFLGTQSDFKKTFFVPIQSSRDPEAVKKLKQLTAPFILRRLKTDKTIISDLPEKMEMKVFCNLTKEQASLYAAVVEEVARKLDSAEGIQRKGMILATLSKLKQVCNHPTQFLGDNSPIPGRSGKLARLTEMLEEVISVGDRALIFTQFSEMGGILKRYLQEMFGREVLFLHGAVPKKQRDSMVERFQADDGETPSIFILSLKAGGTGLNLTRASHVFHFDRWWNPAVENQATDRAFRIGQTKNVQVHKFLCAGTLEEKIDEMIERKKGIAEDVVGTGEGWLTELSTSELKELFALRKEAIGE